MLETPTEISSVIVYTNRALVTRCARNKATQGLNKYVVKGLPSSMEVDSVRVRVLGKKDAVKLVEVKPEHLNRKEHFTDEGNALMAELQSLKKQQTKLNKDKLVQKKKFNFAKNFSLSMQGKNGPHYFPGIAASSLLRKEHEDLSIFISEIEKQNILETRQFDGRQKALLGKISILEIKLSSTMDLPFPAETVKPPPQPPPQCNNPLPAPQDPRLFMYHPSPNDSSIFGGDQVAPPSPSAPSRPAGPDQKLITLRKQILFGMRSTPPVVSTKKQIEISVESFVGEDVSFEITYSVNNATWSPVYDFQREKDEANIVQVKYGAQVSQNSGEDWKDVKIKLSSASTTSIDATPPKLPVVHLSFEKPPQPPCYSTHQGGFCSAPGAGGGLFGASNSYTMNHSVGFRPEPQPPPLMTQMSSEVEMSNSSHVNFSVKKKVTVPSNSQPIRIPVSNFSLPASLYCYIAPEASPRCFVLAMIKNTSDYPIMSSDKCSVLVDGAYVSKTRTNSVNLGETFYLFMGVDADVKASETGPQNVDYESGWINRNNVRIFRQKAFVQNNGKQEKPILVVRSLPRSTDDKIQVKLVHSPQLEKQIEVSHVQNEELLANEAKEFPSNGQYYFNNVTKCYLFAKVLGPQQSEEIPIEYLVEHPITAQLLTTSVQV